ncbi:ElaB/YqjD/DUF883 family membrane-anchored ribosome-binding protein [Aminobacter lissarensis]|uniref:ElaB/YqjD/DUF883 family membrane-anchored ribosome-binding protein n=1 Tax=Aminobacter carboxidus TaxID=376165 RepID=A0A8E1WKM2_9HYPH|nr:hypothetical protein [Aminobacter lissarensis]MBB6470268.1 ElaB/YqjD/DUF883 family membrane-anchored ribosome-binding protein [Aminobacter lissarensis]
MANEDDKIAPKPSGREAQEALEKQVAQMKREIGKINRLLAERAEDAAEEAEGWLIGASDRASRATQALRNQAQSVSETVRTNPGTMSSAMLFGGMIGFLIGCLVSQTNSDSQRHWY